VAGTGGGPCLDDGTCDPGFECDGDVCLEVEAGEGEGEGEGEGDAGSDAGNTDAGNSTLDAGADAGAQVEDAGADGGDGSDAGGVDAGPMPSDAGVDAGATPSDAGVDAGAGVDSGAGCWAGIPRIELADAGYFDEVALSGPVSTAAQPSLVGSGYGQVRPAAIDFAQRSITHLSDGPPGFWADTWFAPNKRELVHMVARDGGPSVVEVIELDNGATTTVAGLPVGQSFSDDYAVWSADGERFLWRTGQDLYAVTRSSGWAQVLLSSTIPAMTCGGVGTQVFHGWVGDEEQYAVWYDDGPSAQGLWAQDTESPGALPVHFEPDLQLGQGHWWAVLFGDGDKLVYALPDPPGFLSRLVLRTFGDAGPSAPTTLATDVARRATRPVVSDEAGRDYVLFFEGAFGEELKAVSLDGATTTTFGVVDGPGCSGPALLYAQDTAGRSRFVFTHGGTPSSLTAVTLDGSVSDTLTTSLVGHPIVADDYVVYVAEGASGQEVVAGRIGEAFRVVASATSIDGIGAVQPLELGLLEVRIDGQRLLVPADGSAAPVGVGATSWAAGRIPVTIIGGNCAVVPAWCADDSSYATRLVSLGGAGACTEPVGSVELLLSETSPMLTMSDPAVFQAGVDGEAFVVHGLGGDAGFGTIDTTTVRGQRLTPEPFILLPADPAAFWTLGGQLY
jgi:hypothetical protein